MPSVKPIPTTTELLDAFGAPILGRFDLDADTRAGAVYDLLGGVGALACRRIAASNQAKFRARYYLTAENADLDTLLARRYLPARILATPGTGTAYLTRATDAGGEGTFLVGTRFTVWPATSVGPRVTFTCRTDQPVGATDTTAEVPIQSVDVGPNTAIDTNTTTGNGFSIDDATWDSSWRITRIVCGPGTLREQDHEVRSRIQQQRQDTRAGYPAAIVAGMKAAGAVSVALFDSDFRAINPNSGIETIGSLDSQGYGDVGISYVIIGGENNATPSSTVLHHCRVAIDKYAVGGASMMVLPQVPTLVTMTVTMSLWDVPEKYGAQDIAAETKQAILCYFSTRDNPFRFRTSVIRGVAQRVAREANQITISTSPAEPAVTSLFSAYPVPRYYVTAGSITVNVVS